MKLKAFGCLSALLLAAAFFLKAGPVAAETERTVTLAEAVATALEENHRLKAAESSVGAAGEDVGAAWSALLPKITLEERFTRTNNPTAVFSAKLNQERFTSADFAIDSLNNPDPVSDFQTSVSIEQPVYVRKAHVGVAMASKEHSAARHDLERARETVAFEVVKAYLRARAAGEFIEVARRGVEDATEHLRIAKLRFENGLGLYSDVLRATTSLRAAEQALVSAEKNSHVSKRALGMLLGLDGPVGVDDSGVKLPLKGLDDYVASAAARSDLRSMELRAENAKNGIKLAHADYLPTLGVGGTYQMNDHENPFGSEGDSWTVSAFLRWSIFDGTLRRHQSAKARHKAFEAAEMLKGQKLRASFGVHEAYLSVEEARRNRELAEAALASAEEGLRLVRTRYENSLSPMVDLLDAELALTMARVDNIIKKNEYMISVAGVSYEGGTILEDLGVRN